MTAPGEKTIRRVAVGSDHAAFELKEAIKRHLAAKGIETVDVGTFDTASVDYPDFAEKVAGLISAGTLAEGILICGTGIGMSIAANKYAGVRAALASTPFMAKMARAHNNANILCLGARVLDTPAALELVDIFLFEPFEGGRHARRTQKLAALDRGFRPPDKTEGGLK